MRVHLLTRLYVLFIMTVSLQQSIPLENPNVSHIHYPDLQAWKFKEKGNTNYAGRPERHTRSNNDGPKIAENNATKDRNKRLETEDGVGLDRNQYYKSLNEEPKEILPAIGSKQEKESSDHRIANDLAGSGKLAVAKALEPSRAARRAPRDVVVLPEAAAALGGETKRLAALGGNSFEDNCREALKSMHRGRVRRRCGCPKKGGKRSHRFSPATMEAIRKINPLTIGDQVAQMIHEHKCNTKSKSICKSSLTEDTATLQSEGKAGVLQSGEEVSKVLQGGEEMSKVLQGGEEVSKVLQDGEEMSKVLQGGEEVSRVSTRGEKHQTAHQQGDSNDYGFSVIILAGDPLKSGDLVKATEGAGGSNCEKDKVSMNQDQKSNVVGNEGRSELASTSNGNVALEPLNANSVGENRVEKNPNANVAFPVYDQDLSFEPDPFNGLLEKNYWAGSGLGGNRNPIDMSQKNDYHRVHVRAPQSVKGKRGVEIRFDKNYVKDDMASDALNESNVNDNSVFGDKKENIAMLEENDKRMSQFNEKIKTPLVKSPDNFDHKIYDRSAKKKKKNKKDKKVSLIEDDSDDDDDYDFKGKVIGIKGILKRKNKGKNKSNSKLMVSKKEDVEDDSEDDYNGDSDGDSIAGSKNDFRDSKAKCGKSISTDNRKDDNDDDSEDDEEDDEDNSDEIVGAISDSRKDNKSKNKGSRGKNDDSSDDDEDEEDELEGESLNTFKRHKSVRSFTRAKIEGGGISKYASDSDDDDPDAQGLPSGEIENEPTTVGRQTPPPEGSKGTPSVESKSLPPKASEKQTSEKSEKSKKQPSEKSEKQPSEKSENQPSACGKSENKPSTTTEGCLDCGSWKSSKNQTTCDEDESYMLEPFKDRDIGKNKSSCCISWNDLKHDYCESSTEEEVTTEEATTGRYCGSKRQNNGTEGVTGDPEMSLEEQGDKCCKSWREPDQDGATETSSASPGEGASTV